MTLTEFLTARLDEDEAVAGAACGERWLVQGWSEIRTAAMDSPGAVEPCWELIAAASKGHSREDYRHVARHDPARVLREVAMKRGIVIGWGYYNKAPQFESYAAGLEIAVRNLAAVYSDHPDYDQDWKP